MNRGDIKLVIDRCIAHDVPDAADMIESLCQQLAASQAVIEGLNGRFAKDQERIARQAEQLAAAIAECKLKDEELQYCEDMLDDLRDYPI